MDQRHPWKKWLKITHGKAMVQKTNTFFSFVILQEYLSEILHFIIMKSKVVFFIFLQGLMKKNECKLWMFFTESSTFSESPMFHNVYIGQTRMVIKWVNASKVPIFIKNFTLSVSNTILLSLSFSYTQTSTHTYTHTLTDTHTHKQAHTLTDTHTHTHTHRHTHSLTHYLSLS